MERLKMEAGQGCLAKRGEAGGAWYCLEGKRTTTVDRKFLNVNVRKAVQG